MALKSLLYLLFSHLWNQISDMQQLKGYDWRRCSPNHSEEDMAAGGSFSAGKWQTSFRDLSGTGSRQRVTLKLSWVSPFPLFIYFGIPAYG